MNQEKKTSVDNYTRGTSTGSPCHSHEDDTVEIISNEVSPNIKDLLNGHYKRHVIKSEPSFNQDEELDEVYSTQFDISSVQCGGETSRAENEEPSDWTNEDQTRKRIKTGPSYQDKDEELFSLADLAGQVQASSLTHYTHDEQINDFFRYSERQELTIIRPYRCDQCNRVYVCSTSSQLVELIRNHTCEKPYMCDQCSKSYSASWGLVSHKRTHTGERPYSCDQCNKSFSALWSLVSHKRTHTGEKPYSCDHCNKSFNTSGSLVLHKRTHARKSYRCDLCSKSFNNSEKLVIHQRTHTDEKPCRCDWCNRSFRSPGSLVSHKRIPHIRWPTTVTAPTTCSQHQQLAHSTNNSLTAPITRSQHQ